MAAPIEKPAVANSPLKEAILRKAKEKVRDLFSISIPSEGMGLTAMKRDIERLKEILELDRK